MNYYNITIEQYCKLKAVGRLKDDPIERQISELAILSGKPESYFETMPLTKLMRQIKNFTHFQTEAPKKLSNYIFVGWRLFKVDWRLTEISSAQFIDMGSFIKDQETIDENIHNIMACLTRRVRWFTAEKYGSHAERAEYFYRKMKIKKAFPVALFFCKFFEELLTVIPSFLEREMEKLKKMIAQANGDGSLPSTT